MTFKRSNKIEMNLKKKKPSFFAEIKKQQKLYFSDIDMKSRRAIILRIERT